MSHKVRSEVTNLSQLRFEHLVMQAYDLAKIIRKSSSDVGVIFCYMCEEINELPQRDNSSIVGCTRILHEQLAEAFILVVLKDYIISIGGRITSNFVPILVSIAFGI